MPRDLFTSDSRDESIVQSPLSQTPRADQQYIGKDNDFSKLPIELQRNESRELKRQPGNGRMHANEKNNLHPYVQTLSISNLESCVALENAIFPEPERCSREKFIYRLTKCPELCLGLFSTTTSPSSNDVPTFDSAHAPNSSTPNLRSVLIAMIIGTKTSAPAVTDECMENPPNWQVQRPDPQDLRGHQEHGQTICVQTLGVLPAYQGRGLAKILMKSYQQRMETSGIAQRIALLAHDYLVRMYESMGFVDKGRSLVKFGGGGWTSLIYDFSEHGPGMMFGS